MKVAIMQPYFLPYLGYFQLVSSVDQFVILDNVNFIKKGWINRNRIVVNNHEYMFNLPVQKVSQNKHIKEHLLSEPAKNLAKLLKTFSLAYKQAPYFDNNKVLLEKLFCSDEQINLTPLITRSIRLISEELNIRTELINASDLSIDNSLTGQDRILALCKHLGAENYINLIGGTSLYNKEIFAQSKIKLNFIKANDTTLNSVIPSPSIIELLMHHDKSMLEQALNDYQLL